MASNSFGTLFKITTWVESHGKAIGVVIDGCPAGIEIQEEEINKALKQRAPGQNPYTSPRKETDTAEILSGVLDGKTTGAPICILIPNKSMDSSKYEPVKELLKPGHANYTYLEKYGIFSSAGGGRSSGRETACRVAAGAVAKKLLEKRGIELVAFLKQVGHVSVEIEEENISLLKSKIQKNSLFCPDENGSLLMSLELDRVKKEGDSLGGVVEFLATGVPPGLGDPIYEKLEAKLGSAMMSLPASKAFEMGIGFKSAALQGSYHNDLFIEREGEIRTRTNHAGGTLGGISNGMPLCGRVAFKPASSIKKPQETLTLSGKEAVFCLPEGSCHDPCVAIRAVPVVEAMVALVLADLLLLNRVARF